MDAQLKPAITEFTASEEGNRRLSYDEGWDLIFSMFGSAREMYAEVGGAEAFMRAERAAWDEDDDE